MPVPNFAGAFGVPNVGKGISAVRSFADGTDPYFPERNLTIVGITKDSTGAALGNCIVHLINAVTDAIATFVTSDAGGNFIIQIPKGLSQPQTTTWYLVAYKAGSPDVAGTTVNTLVGS